MAVYTGTLKYIAKAKISAWLPTRNFVSFDLCVTGAGWQYAVNKDIFKIMKSTINLRSKLEVPSPIIGSVSQSNKERNSDRLHTLPCLPIEVLEDCVDCA